jgi:hypothetical protein
MTATATPADTPADTRAAESDARRWQVLLVLCLALLVTGIDGTIVNVALPMPVRQLHASSSDLQWIVDAYTIVFASFLLIAGNTGDRLGRKRCFVVGLVVFGLGSFGCSRVATPSALILLRALQGFGAAFIMPATLSILTNVFHPVPQSGDLRRDLTQYVHELATVLSAPRARQILGALVAEAASDPELARALRERVVGPRRAEVAARLSVDAGRLRVAPEVAIDQLVGPLFHRALIVDSAIDEALLEAAVAGVVND